MRILCVQKPMNTFLTILLALSTMIWTVQSKSEVSGEGEWPDGIGVDYSCSYQKGTVRQGDEAMLRLSQLGGITLHSVEVYVRSNKSGGAGIFTVSGNGQTLASLAGTYKEWTGAYDNSAYHAIPLLSSEAAGIADLSIGLQGTANSLYIEKYVISYQAPDPCTLTLMEGDEVYASLTEEKGGSGILLPALPDKAEWQFMGWSETEFWGIQTLPAYTAPGTVVYPNTDGCLWSVWKYVAAQESGYAKDLQSGDYIYANRELGIALNGVPENGQMATAPIQPGSADQIYHIEFEEDETATIMHKRTGTYIGYEDAQLVAEPSSWYVYHQGDETLFYYPNGGKYMVLWLNVYDYTTQKSYAGLFATNSLSTSPVGLLHAGTETAEVTYTCHPECGLSIEVLRADEQEIIVPFGIYEIHIKNGKKYLHL